MFRRRIEEILAARPLWLRPVLRMLTPLYTGAVILHRGLYRQGILKVKALPRCVVSVPPGYPEESPRQPRRVSWTG